TSATHGCVERWISITSGLESRPAESQPAAAPTIAKGGASRGNRVASAMDVRQRAAKKVLGSETRAEEIGQPLAEIGSFDRIAVRHHQFFRGRRSEPLEHPRLVRRTIAQL